MHVQFHFFWTAITALLPLWHQVTWWLAASSYGMEIQTYKARFSPKSYAGTADEAWQKRSKSFHVVEIYEQE